MQLQNTKNHIKHKIPENVNKSNYETHKITYKWKHNHLLLTNVLFAAFSFTSNILEYVAVCCQTVGQTPVER